MTTLTIPSETPVEPQQIDDLLSAAFFGGITYWCSDVEVVQHGEIVEDDDWPEGMRYASDALTHGCAVLLTVIDEWPEEGAEPEQHVMGLHAFLKGIGMAAEHMGQSVRHFLDDHDADSADYAVQYAVFGKLVYG